MRLNLPLDLGGDNRSHPNINVDTRKVLAPMQRKVVIMAKNWDGSLSRLGSHRGNYFRARFTGPDIRGLEYARQHYAWPKKQLLEPKV